MSKEHRLAQFSPQDDDLAGVHQPVLAQDRQHVGDGRGELPHELRAGGIQRLSGVASIAANDAAFICSAKARYSAFL